MPITPSIIASTTTSTTVPSSTATRLRYVAGRIHKLGPRPLFELLCELSTSPNAMHKFEIYARLDGDLIEAFDGAELPPTMVLVPPRGGQ